MEWIVYRRCQIPAWTQNRLQKYLLITITSYQSCVCNSLCTQICHYIKKSQDYVKIVGFYRPSHSRPILTPGIQICSQKWSQVNISIGYSYISQVKILYKVKFSKLEICQSDCRFKILAKNCVKKVSFFLQNFDYIIDQN